MRPYIAIIKDSFREALASRVLWAMLLLSTLLLALIVPVGIHERTGIALRPNDITDAKALVEKIKMQEAAAVPSPGKQIWSLLGDDFKAELSKGEGKSPANPWPGMIYLRLPAELQELLPNRKLYDSASWDGIELSEEARDLVALGVDRLDDEDVQRLNRLLLEAAFPNEITPSRQKAVALTYLGKHLMNWPSSKKQYVDAAINWLEWFFCGVVGIFAAILVTAAIVPQTYAAGAIDLLLSKPISRSLLFLTKYLGGCMFVLVNGAYIIGGLWLIAGLRWGQWTNNVLLIIPILVFLFAIYYSVSSLAGVIWRNAIVSVIVAVMFWAGCFVLWFVKQTIEVGFLNPERIVKLVPAGDELVAVNERSDIFHWSTAKANWERIVSGSAAENAPQLPGITVPVIGPVYDSKHDRLFALPVAMPEFGFMPTDNSLVFADNQDNWKRQTGGPPPSGTATLLVNSKGTLLAVTPSGLMKLAGEPKSEKRPVTLFGFNLPTGGGGQFKAASSNLQLGSPLAAAIDRITDEVVIFDTQKLRVLQPDAKGRYVVKAEREIEGNVAGVVAIGGGRVLLGQANGEVTVFESHDLKPTDSDQPEAKTSPRFADVSRDGKFFAVVFHNRRLWIYDTAARHAIRVSVAGNGDITAAAFTPGNRLLVADRLTRVSEYELPSGQRIERRQPSLDGLQMTYFYGIKPIYTVFPKPGEMDTVVKYLLTGSQSEAISPRDDLQTTQKRLDVWGPIWSNLAFIAVVVGLGCLYTQRKDF